MYWHRDKRYLIGGFWDCRVRVTRRNSAHYHSLKGPAYSLLLLQNRRAKALARRKRREMARG